MSNKRIITIVCEIDQPEANWIWENHLAHSSVMLKMNLHKKIGLFNNDLVYSPDYEFWLRSLVSGVNIKVLEAVL